MAETVTASDGRIFDTTYFPRVKTEYTPIPFSEQDFRKNVIGKLRGMGRGSKYADFLEARASAETGSSGSFASLAEMFSKRVCSAHEKNVIFVLFGEPGSGKSVSLLQLALHCSIWISHLRGGTPSQYFSMKNCAVIDDTIMETVVNNIKPYQIVILDDAGAQGFSARNAMSSGNKSISSALQVIRPFHNIIFISAPTSQMVDVQAKRLAMWYGECTPRHDEGITLLKIFRLSQAMRENATYYSYMTHGAETAIRHWCQLPPAALKEVYDRVRREQTVALSDRNRDKAEKRRKEPKDPQPGSGKPPARMNDSEFTEKAMAYLNKTMTLTEMAEDLQMNGKTLTKYLKKNGFGWKRAKNSHKMNLTRVKS